MQGVVKAGRQDAPLNSDADGLPRERLPRLRRESKEMIDCLERLVSAESPSEDAEATASCGALLAELSAPFVGADPEFLRIDGRTHLRWRFGHESKALLLGHFDTVWPVGTLQRWPFAVGEEIASGPGIFDMKAGIVQMLFALRTLEDLDGISILLTSDEEIGSPTSRALVEEEARRTRAALVLEPSAAGALKIARKGSSLYRLSVIGRAAHAGLNPEKGVNAAVEMAHQILNINELGDPAQGTTVTPTVSSAGLTINTVPAFATIRIDARALTQEEQTRVDTGLRALKPVLPGGHFELTGGPDRPPMPPSASAELFERAIQIASRLGLEIEGATVGGSSDGNLAAAGGTPTLDGLGAVGDNAHAEGEYVSVPAMPERAALVAELAEALLRT